MQYHRGRGDFGKTPDRPNRLTWHRPGQLVYTSFPSASPQNQGSAMSDNDADQLAAFGPELLALLKKAAKGGAFASLCSTCGRWYVHFGFAHLPITMGMLDVLSGERGGGRCRECCSTGPTPAHST